MRLIWGRLVFNETFVYRFDTPNPFKKITKKSHRYIVNWGIRFASIGILLLFNLPAFATNGLNAIGFGAKSMGLAGADVAVVDDTYALNINPAGLDEIDQQHLDLYAAAALALDIGHKDQYGNDVEINNDMVMFGNIGYAQRLKDSPFTVGVGFFGQGGAGVEYPNLRTAFGTDDRLISQIRIARLNLGLSYRLQAKTSVGISIITTYADAEQEIFPQTSVYTGALATSFFGYELRKLKGYSPAVKFGLKHKLNRDLTFGMAYTNETALKLEGGYLISNKTALVNGKVVYRDAKIEGIKLPQELNLGLFYRINSKWDISTEFTWLDWSKAMYSSSLTASNPDNAAAPPMLQQTAITDWRDQYVLSIAAQYHYDSNMILRAGYNYGRNPIPSYTLSPILSVFDEHHFTFGSSHIINAAWQLHTAIEYIPSQKVTYTNPSLPFGVNAEERGEMISFHVTASHAW